MTTRRTDDTTERLVQGYERMMERARGVVEQTRDEALPTVRQVIERAQDKAVELGELTREEAEKIGDYLGRDLKDAAEYLSHTGKGLAEWLHFDRGLVEAKAMEMFAQMVDQTRLELDRLAARARSAESLHTGEVTGPGTLECEACGHELRFQRTGHIPPCAGCHGTDFQRRSN